MLMEYRFRMLTKYMGFDAGVLHVGQQEFVVRGYLAARETLAELRRSGVFDFRIIMEQI